MSALLEVSAFKQQIGGLHATGNASLSIAPVRSMRGRLA